MRQLGLAAIGNTQNLINKEMDLEKEALGKLKRILKYKDNNDALAIRIMEQYFFDKQEQQLSLAAVSKSVT